MPRKNAPEFSYNEKTGLYRKRIKDEETGKWVDVYGHTKDETRQKVKQRQAAMKAAATERGQIAYVYEYAKRWYELNTVGLSQSRRDDYKNAINNHICPVIGTLPVADVKPDDVRRVMAACAKMSKSSQQKIVTTLKRIFEAAEENGMIERSPCGRLKAGGEKPAEKIPLTDAQVKTLVDALAGTRCQLFVLIGVYAGLRREEIAGLQWDCVHLDDAVPYIEVRRTVRWINNNKPVLTEQMKSEKAKRSVPIAPQLLTALQEAKATASSDFVVPDTKGGVMSFSSFQRMWQAVESRSTGRTVRKGKEGKVYDREKKLGEKVAKHDTVIAIDFHVTPHILRHTFITNLLLAGANIKTVQYLAGHATVEMTLNTYAHLMENRPADTVGAINLAYSAGGKNSG